MVRSYGDFVTVCFCHCISYSKIGFWKVMQSECLGTSEKGEQFHGNENKIILLYRQYYYGGSPVKHRTKAHELSHAILQNQYHVRIKRCEERERISLSMFIQWVFFPLFIKMCCFSMRGFQWANQATEARIPVRILNTIFISEKKKLKPLP